MSILNVASNSDANLPAQLYRVREILARGKFSKSHLYAMVARGEFPRQIVIGRRLSRWDAEVDIWFADPPAWIKANAIDLAGEKA